MESDVSIRSQASGQHLGFSLQITRALVRLLQAFPGECVSIENIEDIFVEKNNGLFIAEQAKSVTTGNNPVADRSKDLWKAFYNWLYLLHEGHLILDKTEFVIYVSKPIDGDIVNRFSNANNFTEACQSLDYAKNKLGSKISNTIKPYTDKVFNAEINDIANIIKNFKLVCGSGSPQEDLIPLLASKLVPPESYDILILQLQGWVKAKTDRLLENSEKATVGYDEFHDQCTSFIRKQNYSNMLISFARVPTSEEIDQEFEQYRTYIKQLEIIDSTDGEKLRAVDNYLRSSCERTNWSERGLVHESSFDDFEDRLLREWFYCKKQTELNLSRRNDTTKGEYLYAECMKKDFPLENKQVPNYFTPGSYHFLSDAKKLGWHFDYLKLL